MKKLTIILACFLVAMMSCTKSKEVHPEIGDGNDEIVTVGIKDVHVEYARTDHAELNRVIFHYCPADANGNAQQFAAAEMTKKEIFFELTLNDLLSDTLYWYYYELFPNSGDAFNTVQKTFHTQAYGTPEPPTPPTPPTPGNAPEGAIDGLFTINENGDQVYFSQGNLQYQASTNTWRFAEHQWNRLKEENINVSPTYDGWIDLFNWGTSGYNHGANCYQPWSTSIEPSDYYAYGIETCNLNDQTGQADWGYNPISNGGNQENLWRTLTYEEWCYILFERETPSGYRFVKARVNDINGAILLPHHWNESIYVLNNPNQSNAYYGDNTVSAEDWLNILQVAGAVFLPNGANRTGTMITSDENGDYWTSTRKMDGDFAYDICIQAGAVGHSSGNGELAQSVRLVQNASK